MEVSVREKSVSLQTETARTSQRSGTVCRESAAEPTEDCFHFAGFLLLLSVSHNAILCECIIKARYLKMHFCAAHPAQTTVHSPKYPGSSFLSLLLSFNRMKRNVLACLLCSYCRDFHHPQPHPPPPRKSCCLSASVFLPATLFLISRASEETDKVQNPKLTVCLYSAETRLFMENRPDA